jgi:hypothetical protein
MINEMSKHLDRSAAGMGSKTARVARTNATHGGAPDPQGSLTDDVHVEVR